LKFNVKNENVNSTLTSGSLKVKVDGTIITTGLVTAVELWDGSTLITSAAPGTWVSNSSTVSWTDFSLPIAAGTTKTLTVKVVLAQLSTTFTNDGDGFVQISEGPTLTGIDANSNVISNTSTVNGNKMFPFLTAPSFAFISKSVALSGTNSQTHPRDTVDTSITFSVTANNGDIYIPTKSNTSVPFGMHFDPVTMPATNTSSTTWSCNSPAVEDTSEGAGKHLWRIPSGSTANCTFSTTVVNTGGTAGYYRVALKSVKWFTSATSTDASFIPQTWGLTNIDTGDFYLGN